MLEATSVLWIDQEKMVRGTLATMLNDPSFQVHFFEQSKSAEAIQAVQDELRYHIAVVGMTIPELQETDTEAVIVALKKAHSDVPVYVYSIDAEISSPQADGRISRMRVLLGEELKYLLSQKGN